MTTIRSLVDENTWWSLQLDLDKSQAKKKRGGGGEGDQNANANEIDLILHHLISKERELEEIKFSSSFPPDPLPHTLCPSQK